jgi:hypothetical protein
MTHWECWWEWGFKFSLLKDRLKKVDLFNPDKIESLYNSIETKACNPHDDDFEKGWGIIDFVKSNYKFTIRVLEILDWTSVKSRFIIGCILMIWLNTLWIKYFNWKKFF